MLSRVADAIYWMARLVERAENVARFLDVTLSSTLDLPEELQQQWAPLVFSTGDQAYFAQHYVEFSAQNVLRFLTFDVEYHSSVLSCVAQARENARSVREAISTESWEQINEFYHSVRDASAHDLALHDMSDFFRAVKQQCHLFNGLLDATMLRGKGWHFANMGRMLERADKTSRILDVKYFTLLPSVHDVGTAIDDLQWSAVLRSACGLEMYRKRYQAITVHRVVEFLILDQDFPRAIHFCLIQADESLHEITGSHDRSFRTLAEQRLGRTRAELTYTDVQGIVNTGVHQFVDSLQISLNAVDDAIRTAFFPMKR
jgi:uncharacterized alpha-E superfamily protein